MILTCPECASRYVVDDARIGPQGRTVRCAACGGSWRAMPEAFEPPLELRPEPEVREPARPAAAALPRKIRARNEAHRRTRRAVAAGAVWGVLGALVLALLAGAALFRVEVVRLWPRTAGAYAKVGLPVNPTGLTPEAVQATPGLRDGRAAVIVTGQLRNIETRPHEPMPMRVSLLDKSGKVLAAQVTAVAPGKLQPGQTRPFTIAFIDPPTASADVQVEFALDLAGKPHAPAAAPAQAKPAAQHAETEAPAAPLPAAAEAPPTAEAHGHDG